MKNLTNTTRGGRFKPLLQKEALGQELLASRFWLWEDQDTKESISANYQSFAFESDQLFDQLKGEAKRQELNPFQIATQRKLLSKKSEPGILIENSQNEILNPFSLPLFHREV